MQCAMPCSTFTWRSTMLQNLRNHLRFYWLTFLRDLNQAFTRCQRCKLLGAYPCSIAACIPLCEHCQREETVRLDLRSTVDAWVKERRENPTHVNGVYVGSKQVAPFGHWSKRK